jgi:Carboxypeptidase regulatory-like domain
MLLWDSPGTDNRNGFQSIYGARQDVHYSPGDFKPVDIYVWTYHPTKGTVSGTVVMPDGSSVAGCDVSISGQPDIYVGADGAFSFLVPEGWYTVSAGMDHNGMWYSTKSDISITAGETTPVILSLQPPPEVHRLITISVQMTVMKKGWGACGDCDREFSFTQSRSVYPWHETTDIDFQAMYPDGSGWNGYINFPITLHPDLSVTVQYSAQIRKNTEVDHSYGGVFDVAENAGVSYTGLWMRYTNAWHTIEVSIDWTVDNALGPT